MSTASRSFNASRAVVLEPLRTFFEDESVTEILINGPGRVWVERNGVLERTSVGVSRTDIDRLVERTLGPLGRRVDHAMPYVDARLPDGSRVNVVIPPVSVDGPCVSIRRFRQTMTELAFLVRPTEAKLLKWAVLARCNIVVSGGAGCGKTTLLNALGGEIPAEQRVVTIEDAVELCLGAAHVVRLEARPANAEGVGAVTMRDLLRNALRMRPDRIVVGEVRGGEVVEMLQAMNTGHAGSLSTCHANGPVDALHRLEAMVLSADAGMTTEFARRAIAGSVDVVVHLERQSSGVRHIREIAELAPTDPREPAMDVVSLCREGRPGADPHRPPREARVGAFRWSAP